MPWGWVWWACLCMLLAWPVAVAVGAALAWRRQATWRRRMAAALATGLPWPQASHAAGHPVAVVVNPISGSGSAGMAWREVLRPLLVHAGVPFSVFETANAAQPAAVGAGLDLAATRAIVCIGGDGLVHQVLNGVARASGPDALSRVPVVILPAGTTNGLAATYTSATDCTDVVAVAVAAVARLLRHDVQRVDVLAATASSAAAGDAAARHTEYDPFLVSFGLLVYYNRLAERRLRWMHPWIKDKLAVVASIIAAPAHPATVLLRAPEPGASAAPSSTDAAIQYSRLDDLPAADEPPDTDAAWWQVTGPLLLLSLCNIPQAGADARMTPLADPTDGAIDVLMVRGGASRLQLLAAFLQIHTGRHVTSPIVRYFKVGRVVLRPVHDANSTADVSMSGEFLPRTTQYDVTCLRQALAVSM